MKFIFNVIFQHVWAAIVENWGTTASGIIAAILFQGPQLAKFFTGNFQHVDWNGFGAAVGLIAWGVIQKDSINWKSLTGALFNSAPRAKKV